MVNFLFILASVLLIMLSVFLYRTVTGRPLSDLNMLSLSFWILGALCFLPSLLVVIDLPLVGSFSAEKFVYGDFNNKVKAWAIQYWLLIGIPLGALVAKLCLPNRLSVMPDIPKFQAARQLQTGGGFSDSLLFKTISFFFLLFVGVIFFKTGANNPLSVALSGGDIFEILVARNEFSAGSGIGIIDLLFRSDTIIIFSLIVYAKGILTRKKKWMILFLCMFLFSVFLSILSGSTGSIVFYIVIILYLRYMLTGKLINAYQLSAVALLLFFTFAYFKTADDDGTKGDVVAHIFNRIFFEQSRGLYFSLQLFPDTHPFLGFSSTAVWLNKLLDVPTSLDYGHVLMAYYTPEGVESGIAGHFTSIFVTEMWVNFGWYGIIFCPLWVGFVMYCLQYWFSQKKPTLILLIFYAHVAVFGLGYFSDFVRFFYPVNILFMYLGALLILSLGPLFSRSMHWIFKPATIPSPEIKK